MCMSYNCGVLESCSKRVFQCFSVAPGCYQTVPRLIWSLRNKAQSLYRHCKFHILNQLKAKKPWFLASIYPRQNKGVSHPFLPASLHYGPLWTIRQKNSRLLSGHQSLTHLYPGCCDFQKQFCDVFTPMNNVCIRHNRCNFWATDLILKSFETRVSQDFWRPS